MRVAMITPWKVRCGIATYSANLAKALAEKGVDVYIVRLPRFGMLTSTLLQNLVDKIPSDADLIHVQHEYGRYQGLEGGFYAALKRLGKPLVTTMHATGVMPDVDRVVVGASDATIVHNQYCLERLAFKGRVHVIPHGCQPASCPPKDYCRRELGIPEEAPIVGYLGFISPVKGLETLIQAVERVQEAALVVGGGWFVEHETTYIAQLKQWSLGSLKGRCMWLGYVPDDRLAVAYGAMDVVAYPSRAMSESGALLTAISHGKAVLASALPPAVEKQRRGALMTFRDLDDLAEKLRWLLRDGEMRSKLEEGARRYAEEHSWPRVAEKHIELYRQLTK